MPARRQPPRGLLGRGRPRRRGTGLEWPQRRPPRPTRSCQRPHHPPPGPCHRLAGEDFQGQGFRQAPMAPRTGALSAGGSQPPLGPAPPPLTLPAPVCGCPCSECPSERAWTWGHAKVMGTWPVKPIPDSCPQAPGWAVFTPPHGVLQGLPQSHPPPGHRGGGGVYVDVGTDTQMRARGRWPEAAVGGGAGMSAPPALGGPPRRQGAPCSSDAHLIQPCPRPAGGPYAPF